MYTFCEIIFFFKLTFGFADLLDRAEGFLTANKDFKSAHVQDTVSRRRQYDCYVGATNWMEGYLNNLIPKSK